MSRGVMTLIIAGHKLEKRFTFGGGDSASVIWGQILPSAFHEARRALMADGSPEALANRKGRIR